jgi:hypothetical protein
MQLHGCSCVLKQRGLGAAGVTAKPAGYCPDEMQTPFWRDSQGIYHIRDGRAVRGCPTPPPPVSTTPCRKVGNTSICVPISTPPPPVPTPATPVLTIDEPVKTIQPVTRVSTPPPPVATRDLYIPDVQKASVAAPAAQIVPMNTTGAPSATVAPVGADDAPAIVEVSSEPSGFNWVALLAVAVAVYNFA